MEPDDGAPGRTARRIRSGERYPGRWLRSSEIQLQRRHPRVPLEQNDGEFHGYAAGFAQQPGNGAPRTLLNTSASGVSILLDADTNTMAASLHVGSVALLPKQRYSLEF